MRLLKLNSAGKVILLKDYIGDDVPRYAILSHTWGADGEEVTYKDLMDGTGTGKPGYNKIRFCGEQAKRDGLHYFWVDTCCIDKSSSAELQEAINSMFRWYRDANKCYVYLTDVSTAIVDDGDMSKRAWELSFRKSRWFTRGWTLQELIAPPFVGFFTKEGLELGNRSSLEHHIHEVTGIPVMVLRGHSLSDFSVHERMMWAEKRETTRKEDKAYSLLGIFDVQIPLIYGEGRKKAFIRLHDEIEKAFNGTKREDFSVPFSVSDVPEIERFIAREEELAEMHAALSRNDGRGAVVLHGLGGIGKTQLSVAYAKRHKGAYSAIFWLNIKDENSLKQSFTKLARQILRQHPSAKHLSGIDFDGKRDEVVDAVKAWLSLPHNTRWLIVYDNYDNPKVRGNKNPAAVDIRKYLPEAHQGSVIITTRSSQVKIGHSIRIRKLQNVRDSLEILSNASGHGGLINDPDAVRLAEELDGLPLALATAGVFLNQAAISFSDYLCLYKASRAKLQQTSPELSSYEDRTLYSTWQLSFDRIEQQNALSAMLLRFWAYFDNQDVWFELLRHAEPEDSKWIRELTEDELNFHGAIRVLCDHGLVEVDSSPLERVESRGYSIHGCVHSWTINVLNQEWQYDLANMALKFLELHIPTEEISQRWPIQRRLLRHGARCSQMVLCGMLREDGIEGALLSLGGLYLDQGKFDEAEKMYQRALQACEKAWGSEHITTLTTFSSLGNLRRDQGKLNEAEKMYQRALHGSEKAMGTDHPSTLQTVNNLATVYFDQGKLDEAKKMYQRALEGYEQALGPDHTSTLLAVNNMGVLCKDQGKLNEAEKMYQRALQGFEKALGPDHASTLRTVNNLGTLYNSQGKLDEAEKMYQRALEGYAEALGPDHASTLVIINNLGSLYFDQRKLDKAEKMYQWALQGYAKAIGPEHTSTLRMINNLATLHHDQGKLDEAEKMYLQVLQGYEKALSPDHILTLLTANNLGTLYKDQGKLDKAEKMYQRALQGYEKALGPDHTSTLDTLHNMANLHCKRGKLDEAEKMYQTALRGYENALGSYRTSTIRTVTNLGLLYTDQGELGEAQKMCRRVLQGYEKAFGLKTGRSHQPPLDVMWGMAKLCAAQGHLDTAKEIYSQAYIGFHVTLGPSSDVSQSLNRDMASLDLMKDTSNSAGSSAKADTR